MIDLANVKNLIDSNPTEAANILKRASVEEVNRLSNLTPEQKAKINSINDEYRKMLDSHNKAKAYRWKNYYDCVDDYSVCGVMDDAEALVESKMLKMNQVLIESVLRGGYFIHTSRCLMLREVATGKLFWGVNRGKYGDYFVVGEGKFISKTKKINTYLKKGYQPEVRTRVYRCVFDHMSDKGNIVCKDIKLIEEKFHVLDNDIEVVIPEEIPTNTDFIDYCYNNK